MTKYNVTELPAGKGFRPGGSWRSPCSVVTSRNLGLFRKPEVMTSFVYGEAVIIVTVIIVLCGLLNFGTLLGGRLGLLGFFSRFLFLRMLGRSAWRVLRQRFSTFRAKRYGAVR